MVALGVLCCLVSADVVFLQTSASKTASASRLLEHGRQFAKERERHQPQRSLQPRAGLWAIVKRQKAGFLSQTQREGALFVDNRNIPNEVSGW